MCNETFSKTLKKVWSVVLHIPCHLRTQKWFRASKKAIQNVDSRAVTSGSTHTPCPGSVAEWRELRNRSVRQLPFLHPRTSRVLSPPRTEEKTIHSPTHNFSKNRHQVLLLTEPKLPIAVLTITPSNSHYQSLF